MRKLLFGGLVVMAGAAFPPANPLREAVADYRNDSRFHALRSFFTRTGCPAAKYSQVFLETADDYDLDWRLLPSISFVESTGGKWARNNNIFGWDNGNARFESPVAGIRAVGFRLASSGLYRDKEVDEILATYNPNTEYGRKVKSVMRRIAPFQ